MFFLLFSGISDSSLLDQDEVTITTDGEDIFTGNVDSANVDVNDVLCDHDDVDVMTIDDGDIIHTAAQCTTTSTTTSDSGEGVMTDIAEDAIITLDGKTGVSPSLNTWSYSWIHMMLFLCSTLQ